jgi:hypothetical protein
MAAEELLQIKNERARAAIAVGARLTEIHEPVRVGHRVPSAKRTSPSQFLVRADEVIE